MRRETRRHLATNPWCRYCHDDGRIESATAVGWVEDSANQDRIVAVSVCALHRDLVQAAPLPEDH